MSKKYYKTIVQIEILSENEPYGLIGAGESLSAIEYDITEGHFSGVIETKGFTELTAKEAADALVVQGSGTEFFQLDADGNEIDE